MDNEVNPGEALLDVARIHPVVDHLRDLVTSLTALDLQATAQGYWADGREGEWASTSP